MDSVLYPARIVRTMDPSRPSAEAVLVRGDRIRAVGTLDELAAYGPARVDDRYREAVLFPGFVEAHSHVLGAAVWSYTYVGRYPRRDPEGRLLEGCATLDEILDRLRAADQALADRHDPLVAWGLDPIFYEGERLGVRHLDTVSATRPIYVAHASLHVATVNTAMMRREGITRSVDVEGLQKDASGELTGELQEPRAMALCRTVSWQDFLRPDADAVRAFAHDARNHGVTTATDLGSPYVLDPAGRARYAAALDPDVPIRLSVFHWGTGLGVEGDQSAPIATLRALAATPHDKLRFGHVKGMLDGTIQGFTARVQEPGYLEHDGHGVWVTEPERFRELFLQYHAAGLLVHAHCNGDAATEVMLDVVEEAVTAHPRPDHRHTVTHSQLSTAAQYRRMATLGVAANIFANHIYAWGDQHATRTIGVDRAARMDAAATALREGVRISLHCDTPVTPLDPLATAGHAVTRRSSSGRVIGEEERITVPQALEAVTLGAAYQLRMDAEVGSITAGKFADFAVLESDPLTATGEELAGIGVRGTVVGGRHFPT
jgi:predicted amidohydrolase YtcJ